MATYDFVEARGQCRDVNGADHAQAPGDVVERVTGHELIEKPEPLLREGEQEAVLARQAGEPLYGRRSGAAGPQSRLDLFGETGDRRCFEQRAHRQVDPERIAHPREDL